MARALSTAFVKLRPDSSLFSQDAKAQLRVQMAKIGEQTVRLNASDTQAKAVIDSLKARLDELTKRVATARANVDDKQGSLTLDRLELRLDRLSRKVARPSISLDGAKAAALEAAALDLALDKTGHSAQSMGADFGAVSGQAIPALVAAGAALSPVVFTLGAGFGGLGLAAAGVLSPLLKAAHSAKGLKGAWATLTPEQRAAGKSLLALKADYAAFEKALAPVVLRDFSTAVRIAGTVLKNIQPVTQATGRAFGVWLGQFGATLNDPQWRQFWAFMATTAPQDIRLLGGDLIQLANTLPPLLRALQPVAVQILTMVGGVTNLIRLTAQYANQVKNLAGQSGHGAGAIAQLGDGVKRFTLDLTTGGIPEVQRFWHWLNNAGGAAQVATPKVKGTGTAAQQMAAQVKAARQRVTELTTAVQAGLNPLLNYSNALINQKTDAKNLADALKKSHDQIGLQTAAQRNSFTAANTYIGDLIATASKAQAAGHGVAGEITMLKNALPALENAKSHSRTYWQEVRTLIGWLDKLKAENVREKIHITGSGRWAQVLRQGSGAAGHATGAAAGWRVPGFGGGDKHPALLEGGEAVIDKHRTKKLAPLFKAIGVPGFAGGGIVGSFDGVLSGLQPWAAHNERATRDAIMTDLVRSLGAAAPGGGFGVVAGPGGGDPARNAALAHSLYSALLTPGAWQAWNYVAMRESGWSQFAENPTSGAYGIPQALPPTKLPFAGQKAGGSNPMAQIGWMWDYMASRYGGPAGAAAHEAAFNWYGTGGLVPKSLDHGGWLKPGLTLAYNGTGRPEPVGAVSNTYHLTVNVAPSGNPAEVGRQVVYAIREFERRSGSSWRQKP